MSPKNIEAPSCTTAANSAVRNNSFLDSEGYPATSLHVLSIAFPAKVSATSSQAITSKPVAVKQELEWPAPLYLEFSLG